MQINNGSDNIKFKAVKKTFRERLFDWLRLTSRTTVRVYRGYGRDGQLQLFGHVLELGPVPPKRYSRNIIRNFFGLIRLFIVRPKPNARVQLVWQQKTIKAVTAADGFFHFQWTPEMPTDAGWHEVKVDHISATGNTVLASATGSIFIPHRTQYGCISDIDDTFLISHSSRLGKRLFVLFTHNARTRKPFAGVVEHYRMLSYAGSHEDTPNPFFYVSSSEWNLFDYIVEFTRTHKLPNGVLLLSQLKHWYQLLKTGQNKHGTKFTRIARILESYPNMRFVLLGDDSQEDPNIYNAIVKHFGSQIICVYLRNVRKASRPHVENVKKEIETAGVHCCYFQHSEEAIDHSLSIGLAEKQVSI
ncbi:DUF2183 domain-containing protein [Chitinophaga horti]|uniref:DUF2183 domain-containing protein n=1 Tax=Chitinophaga horti TaxID=2920382 RepID=A0ABY6J5R7_9BACT|nr:phosphatase domain-containing protein [Chitinophaga horti]UYQ95030.1 DUF2183 domain-containing protein [Chitinophaga horti]